MNRRYYYDLHIHSCLSPCGDEDNTPNNIVGMAKLCELDIIALTDHNSTKNCPAFFKVAEQNGIIPIAGMELTTSEDIHAVCLFEHLSDAMSFNEFIEGKRMLIKNRPDIFGDQLILDEKDEVIGKEDFLLTNATEISIDSLFEIVSARGGVCYPAHIDRDSNGIVAILGALPLDLGFRFFELRDREKQDLMCEKHAISPTQIIVSSDAHYLENMRDKENYFTLPDSDSPSEVRRSLFRYLRGEL